MDEKYLAYETLVAARDSAQWAFGSMVASFASACISLLAAIAAIWALRGWRAQERTREWKSLNVSVFRFQAAINMCPDIVVQGKKDPQEFQRLMRAYDSLDRVYECALSMHNIKIRSKAAELYTELAEVHEFYTSGQYDRKRALDEILEIRTTNHLLNSDN